MFRIIFGLCCLIVCSSLIAQSPIQVPEGFKITKVASDELATNIYSLTVDANGQTVVAGPGYVKRLIDQDRDGIYDSFQLISQFPKNGAQGLYFDGPTLYAVGDQGVLRMSDPDGDGVYGPPTVALKIKTGGEHDAHAIRRGPDDNWYLLCGNGVPIPESATSRIESRLQPHAGFLLRMDDDFSRLEIVNDGFRNPYDFDFNSDGDVFTFDSDGERDFSLPWYQPTRVYRLLSGDSAGWVTASWKHPDHFPTMPDVVARLGRGSPTGVICYQHDQFPKSYFDAIFVLDWTYGRIVVCRRDPVSGKYFKGELFAAPSGASAFAVTDAEVAPDGTLLVSIGGRGTEGAVYRIESITESSQEEDWKPQSNSSWARNLRSQQEKVHWEDAFDVIKNQDASVAHKLQAIEFARQHDGPVSAEQVLELNLTDARLVRKLFGSLAEGMTERKERLAKRLLSQALSLEMGSGAGDLIRDLLLEISSQELISEWDYTSLAAYSPWYRLALDFQQEFETRFGHNFVPKKSQDWPAIFNGYLIDDASSGRQLSAEDEMHLVSAMNVSSGVTLDEWARMVAIGRITSPNIRAQLIRRINEDSEPVRDIHLLAALTRSMRKPSTAELRQWVTSLLNVAPKIAERQLNTDRNWPVRMRELAATMIRQFRVGDLIANHPAIVLEENFFLIEILSAGQKQVVRMSIADSILQDSQNVSSQQISFLGEAKDNIYCGLIRVFREETKFTDSVIRSLARNPVPDDRACFLRGLRSINRDTWRLSSIGLRKLKTNEVSDSLLVLGRAIRLGDERNDLRVKNELLRFLVDRHRKQVASATEFDVRRWQKYFQAKHASLYNQVIGSSSPAESLRKRFATLDIATGNEVAGRKVFEDLLCAKCHDGGSRLGPSLKGISNRFSDADIFTAIVDPDQQVPVRYRALKIQTIEGDLHYGSVVYESVDGIVMMDQLANTLRINQESIEAKAVSETSLMPSGLLDQASDRQLVDLFKYLKTLK